MTKKKEVKEKNESTNIVNQDSTEQEIKDIAGALNSWSPLIFIQTFDLDTLFTDISSAIKRINREANVESRTKLLWFNMASGLSEIEIISEKDMKDKAIKAEAPNGLKLNNIKARSQAVNNREVDYKLDQLLKEYSEYHPSKSANSHFQSSILMLTNIDKELENNTNLRHSMVYFLKQTEVFFSREDVNRQILVVSTQVRIPPELERSNIVYHHKGYTMSKMIESLIPEPKKASDEEKVVAEKVANSMAGLTLTESQSVLNLMANRKPDNSNKQQFTLEDLSNDDINFLTHRRKEIVNRGGLLSIEDPKVYLKDIGGNELIKEFIQEQKQVYVDLYGASKFGLQNQRGVLFLGPPGTGKSTMCQAVAGELRAPYMVLDLSKIMESRVGSSEANIEMALAMAEKIGGVLQIDEIEKKLGGIESSNKVDGGITLRIFDTILKYMARDNNVIFIATANNIKGLPPELTRKGRIDDIFLIDFPCVSEIAEILAIHIRKSGRKIDDIISATEEAKIVKSLDQYTGSEIKYIVNRALRKAYISTNKELTYTLLHDIIKDTVPMSKTYKKVLDEIRDWAITIANPASKDSAFAKLRRKKLDTIEDKDKTA